MCTYLIVLIQLKMQEDAIGGEYMEKWQQKLEEEFEAVVQAFGPDL